MVEADTNTVTNWCPRCGVGIDDDGDGDCAVCASASNRIVAALRNVRECASKLEMELHTTRVMLDRVKRGESKF